ncbi:carbamoyltransferase HypF [Methylomonas sp. SURF-1]|uniref:Carbamoyltransferase HypF n=1 Tax=Methylomonas aurea TaxID=2952224 RepID=A0ABT1UGA9_9GAMM|nr:carbamoyltransferase HypF [Methylomonas sp. SURF-1]MCQ8180725.1 carbamoyltransferase HypF [Methylomonas sp. SURF-1]
MAGKAIRARGVVQGVGFRPAMWHLARRCGLTGEVWNDGEGVMIHAFGSADALERFIARIPCELPPLARLDGLECLDLNQAAPDEFRIVASRPDGIATPIAADAATCPECLADIADPTNRRYRYPFTNCTHCGPRLSIVRAVPFDRANTSMAAFAMCPDCQREYDDPADRRFHAQANCCPVCGPSLWLEAAEDSSEPALGATGSQTRMVPFAPSISKAAGENPRAQVKPLMLRPAQHQRLDLKALAPDVGSMDDVIRQAAELIRQGRIVAIKGLGGFHLACDATNAAAVDSLRQRKRRYAKPFALMARDLAMVHRFAAADAAENLALQDRAAPIVLLRARGEALAGGVAPGDAKLGFMLPYTPLHTLLMQELDNPIVLTSGNVSDEPQCIDNDDARQKLAGIADFFLLHQRDIVNRLDDSVARLMDGEIRLLRRARGYAPQALPLPPGFEQAAPVLAMGAELKNSFCLLRSGQAVVSQHIGDLENAAVQTDYRHAIELYRQLHGFRPERIAIDRHPGYLSSQYGQSLAAAQGLPCLTVQHHHAHLAACLAEHGVALDAPPVLAAIFDGLGMGENGELWGGEFLLGDYRGFSRLGHFQPIALPGGSQAMREPWRNAYAQLRHYFVWDELLAEFGNLPFLQGLANKPLATLDTMMAKNLNAPLCSSVGRWFDAFAAVLDLHAERADYEGQAAIALENLAAPAFAGETAYPQAWQLNQMEGKQVLTWRGLWQAVLRDLAGGCDKAAIAARIHHSLIAASVESLCRLGRESAVDTVVLSGGVFQNRLLLEGVAEGLRRQGKTVLLPQRYPANDGGLALGQAVIAAAAGIS